ncbi:lysylphosphatidylglycerol synthase domain-containing protein [Kribbia dieselivorans]|uniref:lysylphosphatidylglycerol synthase domain-containing protein n=1 Tax=Kribbia dieselivorans TaxID=331526 RepID=UPI0008386844|nr:lysylphosphatidylglycerol synthase domain-containing protein [Kribbia dieselivorans]
MAAATKRRVLFVLRWVLIGAALVAVVIALIANWGAVSTQLGRVSLTSLVLSTLLAFISPIVTMLGWRVLLEDSGSKVPLGPASSIFFVGQLGKYVPGSVWSVVVQTEMGAAAKIPRRTSAIAGLLTIVLSAIAGLAVGIPAFPALLGTGGVSSGVWMGIAVVPLLLILLYPPVLNRVIRLVFTVAKREAPTHDISGKAILITMAWFIFGWIASGASIWVLARDLAHPDRSQELELAMASLSGFPLAASLGMFSFIMPAGVGVREGLLVLVYRGLMYVSAASALAILSRFILTLVDIVCAVFGWVWGRSHHLIAARSERRANAAPSPAERVE